MEEVTIGKAEYEDLMAQARFLTALKVAGVDNWKGYPEAMRIFEEENIERSRR